MLRCAQTPCRSIPVIVRGRARPARRGARGLKPRSLRRRKPSGSTVLPSRQTRGSVPTFMPKHVVDLITAPGLRVPPGPLLGMPRIRHHYGPRPEALARAGVSPKDYVLNQRRLRESERQREDRERTHVLSLITGFPDDRREPLGFQFATRFMTWRRVYERARTQSSDRERPRSVHDRTGGGRERGLKSKRPYAKPRSPGRACSSRRAMDGGEVAYVLGIEEDSVRKERLLELGETWRDEILRKPPRPLVSQRSRPARTPRAFRAWPLQTVAADNRRRGAPDRRLCGQLPLGQLSAGGPCAMRSAAITGDSQSCALARRRDRL